MPERKLGGTQYNPGDARPSAEQIYHQIQEHFEQIHPTLAIDLIDRECPCGGIKMTHCTLCPQPFLMMISEECVHVEAFRLLFALLHDILGFGPGA